MKFQLICFASVLALAACGVDSSPSTTDPAVDDPEAAQPQGDPEASTQGFDSLSIKGTCSTLSPGFCSGQAINTTCSLSPRRWCLPAQELPNGDIFCLCQAQSTI
jgi:hypothetical protein